MTENLLVTEMNLMALAEAQGIDLTHVLAAAFLALHDHSFSRAMDALDDIKASAAQQLAFMREDQALDDDWGPDDESVWFRELGGDTYGDVLVATCKGLQVTAIIARATEA
jgi:hypothetical protein